MAETVADVPQEEREARAEWIVITPEPLQRGFALVVAIEYTAA